MGDADYMYAFQRIVMPVAQEFAPDLVMSTYAHRERLKDADRSSRGGFRRRHRRSAWRMLRFSCLLRPHDSHADVFGERESRCLLRGTQPSHHRRSALIFYQGGYNLTSIARSALAVTRTLMGEPPDRLAETRASTSGAETVEQVVLYQSRFWTSLHAKEVEDGEKMTYAT